MLAIVGAILFGLALLINLAQADLGRVINVQNLTLAGFICVALHLAGVAARTDWRSYGRRRRVRR